MAGTVIPRIHHDGLVQPAFPTIEFKDRRLPMKELVYSIRIGDDHVVYSKDFIMEQGNNINVEIGGKPVVIDYDPDFDSVSAFFYTTDEAVSDIDVFGNTGTGVKLERVNTLKSRLFWFMFAEFYPDTDVNRV